MKKWIQKLPLFPLCAAGFLLGMICCRHLGQEANLLAPERLKALRDQLPEPDSLIPYLCWNRGKWVIFLILVATTNLAPLACRGTAIWIGWSLGTYAGMAFLQYGIKGVLLVFAGLYPQWFVYGPGLFCLMETCMELHRAVPFGWATQTKKSLAKLLLCLLFLGTGILMECHWNPLVLRGILSRF